MFLFTSFVFFRVFLALKQLTRVSEKTKTKQKKGKKIPLRGFSLRRYAVTRFTNNRLQTKMLRNAPACHSSQHREGVRGIARQVVFLARQCKLKTGNRIFDM